jgi:hypothetical protein
VPAGAGDPVSRVTTATRLIAIRIPNDKDDTTVQRTDPWEDYVSTADALEAATGLDLFGALPPTVQRVLEGRADVGALPYTLTISGTAALSTTVGLTFPAPLAVRVTGAGGEPIADLPVTFAALGVTASIAGDPVATVRTDANGVAAITPAANATTGAYRLEASLAGVFEPAVFSLENVVPAAPPPSLLYLPLLRQH